MTRKLSTQGKCQVLTILPIETDTTHHAMHSSKQSKQSCFFFGGCLPFMAFRCYNYRQNLPGASNDGITCAHRPASKRCWWIQEDCFSTPPRRHKIIATLCLDAAKNSFRQKGSYSVSLVANVVCAQEWLSIFVPLIFYVSSFLRSLITAL